MLKLGLHSTKTIQYSRPTILTPNYCSSNTCMCHFIDLKYRHAFHKLRNQICPTVRGW